MNHPLSYHPKNLAPPAHVNDVYDVPSRYHFTYHVSDSYSGDVHHHSESKSDHKTEGQYSVKLPDGRTQVEYHHQVQQSQIHIYLLNQVVTYTADDGGYHAVVEYHGGDLHHHQPPPPHHVSSVQATKHQYKYDPTPRSSYHQPEHPPLLPKLFSPSKSSKESIKPAPALKLDKPAQTKYRYSPLPTLTPRLLKPTKIPFYKGKITFLEKP